MSAVWKSIMSIDRSIPIGPTFLLLVLLLPSGSCRCDRARGLIDSIDLLSDSRRNETSQETTVWSACPEAANCCSSSSTRSRLLRLGTTTTLADWMQTAGNNRLVSALNASLAHSSEVMRARLSLSEQKLHHLFEETFPRASMPIRPVIGDFFNGLYRLLIASQSAKSAHQSGQEKVRPGGGFLRVNIGSSIRQLVQGFYSGLFPPLYACVWTNCHERGYALTANYSKCIRSNFEQIDPFGDAPQRLSAKLTAVVQPLAVASALFRELSALIDQQPRSFWAELWPSSDPVLDSCRLALFQLHICPLCSGRTVPAVRPCRSACQSAVQLCVEQQQHRNGPLARLDQKLDVLLSQFESYVRSAADPASSTLEDILDGIKNDILEALNSNFHLIATTISAKVLDFCGPVQNEDDDKVVVNNVSAKKHSKDLEDKLQIRSTMDRNSPTIFIMARIAQNLSSTFSGFFGRRRLASTICQDQTTEDDSNCWNPSSKFLQTNLSETAATATRDNVGGSTTNQDKTALEGGLDRITDRIRDAHGHHRTLGDDRPVPPRFTNSQRNDRYGTEHDQWRYTDPDTENGGSGDGSLQDDDEDGHEIGSGNGGLGPYNGDFSSKGNDGGNSNGIVPIVGTDSINVDETQSISWTERPPAARTNTRVDPPKPPVTATPTARWHTFGGSGKHPMDNDMRRQTDSPKDYHIGEKQRTSTPRPRTPGSGGDSCRLFAVSIWLLICSLWASLFGYGRRH